MLEKAVYVWLKLKKALLENFASTTYFTIVKLKT